MEVTRTKSYSEPNEVDIKHKEAFNTLVESLVQMTCIDFTNFLKIGRVYNIKRVFHQKIRVLYLNF